MRFFRAMWRVLRPRTAYERLVREWVEAERAWRVLYRKAPRSKRREIMDELCEQRRLFQSRKLELEDLEREAPYRPVVLQPPPPIRVSALLLEKGYGLFQ